MDGRTTKELANMTLAAFAPLFRDAVRQAESLTKGEYGSFQLEAERTEKQKNAALYGSWVNRHSYQGTYRIAEHLGFDVQLSYDVSAGALGFSQSDRVDSVSFVVTEPAKPVPRTGCVILSVVWLMLGCAFYESLMKSGLSTPRPRGFGANMDEVRLTILSLSAVASAFAALLAFVCFTQVQGYCFPSRRQRQSRELAQSAFRHVDAAFSTLERAIVRM